MNDAISVITKLKEKGFEAYLVGGCVRDYILDKVPNDYDICTNASPSDMMRIFNYELTNGIEYGCVTILEGSSKIQVTTYRTEQYNGVNRSPSVRYSRDVKEDVIRRDFTINGLLQDENLNIIDYVGGVHDLVYETIKFVGDPRERIMEDPLRILRAIRFSCTLNFTIDPDHFIIMKELRNELSRVSAERIQYELNKMFSCNNVKRAIYLLKVLGYDFYGLPIKDCFNYVTNGDYLMQLAHINHSYLYKVSDVLNSLKYTKSEIAIVIMYIMCYNNIVNSSNLDVTIKEIINEYGETNFLKVCEYIRNCNQPLYINVYFRYKNILNRKEACTIKDLKINGEDLIKLDVPEHKRARVLNYCLETIHEFPVLNTKPMLKSIIKDFLQEDYFE